MKNPLPRSGRLNLESKPAAGPTVRRKNRAAGPPTSFSRAAIRPLGTRAVPKPRRWCYAHQTAPKVNDLWTPIYVGVKSKSEKMSRGTAHNSYNRVKQRALEDAEFESHDPVLKQIRTRQRAGEKAKIENPKRVQRAIAAAAAERRKGRLELCSVCREFFRSNSPEVGIFVCPKCRKSEIAKAPATSVV